MATLWYQHQHTYMESPSYHQHYPHTPMYPVPMSPAAWPQVRKNLLPVLLRLQGSTQHLHLNTETNYFVPGPPRALQCNHHDICGPAKTCAAHTCKRTHADCMHVVVAGSAEIGEPGSDAAVATHHAVRACLTGRCIYSQPHEPGMADAASPSNLPVAPVTPAHSPLSQRFWWLPTLPHAAHNGSARPNRWQLPCPHAAAAFACPCSSHEQACHFASTPGHPAPLT